MRSILLRAMQGLCRLQLRLIGGLQRGMRALLAVAMLLSFFGGGPTDARSADLSVWPTKMQTTVSSLPIIGFLSTSHYT